MLLPTARCVTKVIDILAVNWWASLRSKLGWAVSILVAAALTAWGFVQNSPRSGQPLAVSILVIFAAFVVFMTLIFLAGWAITLIVASVDMMRQGVLGPKTLTISEESFSEDDGHRVTEVRWRDIRSIDKTRRHIFVRVSRWRAAILAGRDFETEYHFVQYYALLVKARHENTSKQT